MEKRGISRKSRDRCRNIGAGGIHHFAKPAHDQQQVVRIVLRRFSESQRVDFVGNVIRYKVETVCPDRRFHNTVHKVGDQAARMILYLGQWHGGRACQQRPRSGCIHSDRIQRERKTQPIGERQQEGFFCDYVSARRGHHDRGSGVGVWLLKQTLQQTGMVGAFVLQRRGEYEVGAARSSGEAWIDDDKQFERF